jgi:hypothetical protein
MWKVQLVMSLADGHGLLGMRVENNIHFQGD